jgi:hypothetical protein
MCRRIPILGTIGPQRALYMKICKRFCARDWAEKSHSGNPPIYKNQKVKFWTTSQDCYAVRKCPNLLVSKSVERKKRASITRFQVTWCFSRAPCDVNRVEYKNTESLTLLAALFLARILMCWFKFLSADRGASKTGCDFRFHRDWSLIVTSGCV